MQTGWVGVGEPRPAPAPAPLPLRTQRNPNRNAPAAPARLSSARRMNAASFSTSRMNSASLVMSDTWAGAWLRGGCAFEAHVKCASALVVKAGRHM